MGKVLHLLPRSVVSKLSWDPLVDHNLIFDGPSKEDGKILITEVIKKSYTVGANCKELRSCSLQECINIGR